MSIRSRAEIVYRDKDAILKELLDLKNVAEIAEYIRQNPSALENKFKAWNLMRIGDVVYTIVLMLQCL